MPGYNKSRFENLTKNESEILECGICLAILQNPNITKYCGQAYCSECILEWILKSPTCPYDRKEIAKCELMPAPLLVINLLKCLPISCKYKDNGCAEVKNLKYIEVHEKKCKFNSEAICSDCNTLYGMHSQHNCINNLKANYESIAQDNHNLKCQNELLKTESSNKIDILKKEIEELRKNLTENINEKYILSNQKDLLEIEVKKIREENEKYHYDLYGNYDDYENEDDYNNDDDAVHSQIHTCQSSSVYRHA